MPSDSPKATAATACSADDMRWLLVFLLAFVVFNGLRGWLQKIGLGKLPGDFHLKLGQREVYVPLGSSLVLSFLAMLIGYLI